MWTAGSKSFFRFWGTRRPVPAGDGCRYQPPPPPPPKPPPLKPPPPLNPPPPKPDPPLERGPLLMVVPAAEDIKLTLFTR